MNHCKIFCWWPGSLMGPPDEYLRGIAAPDTSSWFGKLCEVREPNEEWAVVLTSGDRFQTIARGSLPCLGYIQDGDQKWFFEFYEEPSWICTPSISEGMDKNYMPYKIASDNILYTTIPPCRLLTGSKPEIPQSGKLVFPKLNLTFTHVGLVNIQVDRQFTYASFGNMLVNGRSVCEAK